VANIVETVKILGNISVDTIIANGIGIGKMKRKIGAIESVRVTEDIAIARKQKKRV
jgi:hypothetical protein